MQLENYLNLALAHIESLKKELTECKNELNEYKQKEYPKKKEHGRMISMYQGKV